MIIVLRLEDGSVTLEDPGSFGEFSVRVEGGRDPAKVGELALASTLGHLRTDQEHIVVEPGAVRRLAANVVNEAWEQGFSSMCGFAASKGWVEDGGILAHIDWEDA